jgi:hypothetical protein
MPTKADYAKLGIAKRHFGDQTYRDIMATHCHGKTSGKLLDAQERATLYSVLAQKGWRPTTPAQVKDGRKATKKVRDNYRRIQDGPAAKQQRYCLALWAKLGYEVKKLDARCKKQFGIDRIEWVTEQADLHILITDLRQRCVDAGLDPYSK